MSPVGSETEFKMRLPGLTAVFMAIIVPLALLTIGVMVIFPHSLEIMQTAKYWHHMAHDPRGYLILAVTLWAVVQTRLQSRYERLYVGRTALRYASPFGGCFRFLNLFRPDWSLPWPELQKAELQVQSLGLGKRRYSLVFQTASAKRVLEWPLYWQRVPFAPGPMAKPPRRDEAEMRRAIMNSPLVQALRAAGVQVVERAGLVRPDVKGYDIAQDKQLRMAVALLLVCGVYYLWDTFIEWDYMALGQTPAWFCVPLALFGLWLGLRLSRHAPNLERTVITLLLAFSLGAASYPLALRFNALTAPSGEIYAYTQVAPGHFKPPDEALPPIDLQYNVPYWGQFKQGSTHQFHVLKGALGFYELDTGRVQQEVHAWWRTQKFR